MATCAAGRGYTYKYKAHTRPVAWGRATTTVSARETAPEFHELSVERPQQSVHDTGGCGFATNWSKWF